MATNPFDYAIVGAGAAGLQLVLAFIEDGSFTEKSILIIDRDEKNTNDRTWSFWETGVGKWDEIAYQKWQNGVFIHEKESTRLQLGAYQYKTIRSEDFYAAARRQIEKANHITWIKADVTDVIDGAPAQIETSSGPFRANHVFDSRIDPSFFQNDDGHIRVLQHFKGWFIETQNEVFDPNEFVMMDFRVRWKNTTSFTYILPVSKTKALVEFTFFSPKLEEEYVYDQMLEKYLELHLDTGGYEILEKETGVIPMSNFPFHKFHQTAITKIGTAGGWVKPSSGYSFKNAERFSKQVVQNIKKGLSPGHSIGKKRHRKYDTLFLDLLFRTNDIGPELFTDMYTKLPSHLIFKFLDEETTIPEEIRIVSVFRAAPFLKALLRQWV
jgi:lycopene beta-cyclase